MTRLTRLCRAVGVGLAVATATLSMTQLAYAAPPQPDVPQDLVPGGVSQFLVAHAKGVQIYKCTASGWTFDHPEAALVGAGGQKITHNAGPTWTADADSSAVNRDPNRAVKSVSVTPADHDIPWLLVPVKTAGTEGTSNDRGDLLTGTTFVQRIHTQGGTQPPNAECKAQTADKLKGVPYQADYVFFR
jgi:Protein of unknown function (DUF3455)